MVWLKKGFLYIFWGKIVQTLKNAYAVKYLLSMYTYFKNVVDYITPFPITVDPMISIKSIMHFIQPYVTTF